MAAASKAKPLPKKSTSRAVQALSFWQAVLMRGLDDLPHDLSSRQMSVLLFVYLEKAPHSVKLLSEALLLSKPAVCRALDVLEQKKLIKRVRDTHDKRNVFIEQTHKGSVYLASFADIIIKVSRGG